MKRHIEKVAVLGSGVMGSAIAAHFANAGIHSLVLDIVPRELSPEESKAGLTLEHPAVRNRIAARSVQALTRTRPAPLFTAARHALIEIGNLEDDLHRLREADWVIEVVREDPEIKDRLLASIAPHLGPDAVLSSNTSGLSLERMSRALPAELRPRFLGTHFFNPPRYMSLLELIPTSSTDPQITEAVGEFARRRLGKGVVPAKDTPNFIANRIGIHSMMSTLRVMQERQLSPEEVDALTGPALGRPRSATLKLADMVGLDTLLLVADNVFELAADDESREIFKAPDYLREMVSRGLLGRKSGAGFYARDKADPSQIRVLDLERLDYREQQPPNLPELKPLREIAEPVGRIRALIEGESRGSLAAWEILATTLSYSAMRLGEIADQADSIDRAMRLGFNWDLGPFETWDALGFRVTTARLRADGYPLPPWIDALEADGAESLYLREGGCVRAPMSAPGKRAPVAADPRRIDFDALRAAGREIRRNDSSSLIDLGDGVLALEFRTKMNVLDQRIIEMITSAIAEAESNHAGLVVANYGANFCAGANLQMIIGLARERKFDAIEGVLRSFQEATNRLELCAVPVVIAPHGMALGGGAEVVLAGNAVQAAAEAYIGLVEVGAGLVPAGGGCLRLYRRKLADRTDVGAMYSALKSTFEAIGMAKVSTSAEEARDLGFLRPSDRWSMNRDHLVSDAKQLASSLAASGYAADPAPPTLPVMGRGGAATIESALVNMFDGRFISEHDRKIGREVARILSGGDLPGPTSVPPSHLLDLERESFLRLCGEEKTHARMESLLRTGKPLRN